MAALLGLAGLWQILSLVYTAEALPGEPMIPGWQVIFTRTFLSLGAYREGGITGAEPTYYDAVLSILQNSAVTIGRLLVGLALGAVAGSAVGLAVSWSSWSRRLVNLPAQFLRTLPLLAMVPLFQVWFGTYFIGMVIFIAYGVGVIFFTGIVNAVGNVPQIYIDNARTFGAGRLWLYRTVILPAILPELRSTILLSLGTAWAAVLGAEYLGAQSGLGYIVVYSEQFAYLDRMFLVALLFILYASISYALFNALCSRLLRWLPRAGRDSIPF
jgi:sulfonate transport system permease protein